MRQKGYSGGSGGSGVVVGDPVTNGTPNSVLIENAAGEVDVVTPLAPGFLAWDGVNFSFAAAGVGVQSVTGAIVDNTDPINPVLTINTDTSMTGDGSVALPLSVLGGGSVVATLRARVATTAVLAGSPTYNNGTGGVGATLTRTGNGAIGAIDGVTLVLADRLLVKNQASQFQNGIYSVTTVGNAGTAYVLTRTSDSDSTGDFMNQTVGIQVGTVNHGLIYGQTTLAVTVGSSNVVYTDTGGIYVIQAPSGTQINGAIPTWTGVAKQLRKGSADLFHDINQFTARGNNFGIYKEFNYSNNNLGDLGNGSGVYAGDDLGPATAINGAEGKWEFDAMSRWSNTQRAWSSTYEVRQYSNGTDGTFEGYVQNTSTNAKGSIELTAGTAALKGDTTAGGISQVLVSTRNVEISNFVAVNAAVSCYTPSSGQQRTAFNLPSNIAPTSTVTANGSYATVVIGHLGGATYVLDSNDAEVPDNTVIFYTSLTNADQELDMPSADSFQGREVIVQNYNGNNNLSYKVTVNFTNGDFANSSSTTTDWLFGYPYQVKTYKSILNALGNWSWVIANEFHNVEAVKSLPYNTDITIDSSYPSGIAIDYGFSGTGTSTVDISDASLPIGFKITVTDGFTNAQANPITVDAGALDITNGPSGAATTYVINVDNDSRTFVKKYDGTTEYWVVQ